jgi:hypothetical protein
VSITELEERVYEHGNPVDLAVLGDALASLGDPRGTLIALEATAGHPLWVAKPIPHYFEGTEREEPWRAELLSWAGPALAHEIANGCVELRFHAGFGGYRWLRLRHLLRRRRSEETVLMEWDPPP